MKKLKLAIWVLAVSLLAASCKKDSTSDPDNNPASKYYITADFDGSPYKYETSGAVECFQYESEVCFPMVDNSFQDVGVLHFFDMSADSITQSYFIQMKGKTYPMSSMSKRFSFETLVNGDYYTTENLDDGDRTGSFIVTDVVADGGTSSYTDAWGNPYKCFKLTGTFSCNAENGTGDIKNFTNGKFVIRFNEVER